MNTLGLVLDAGPFLALERRDRFMTELVSRITVDKIPIATSAGVVAQVWRGGSGKQFPIAYLLRLSEVIDLTFVTAKFLGKMLGQSGTRDPVDAHIAWLARERNWPVITSDPDDLLRIDPSLVIQKI